jgi:predicted nucleotidyltransferase component of viral defense system
MAEGSGMTELETLLIEVIDRMADRFESQAILRGGMVLRVLGCERFTNDVDYLLVPFRSKKDVVPDLLRVLGELENVTLTHSLNSKCLRVTLKRGQTVAQVEIKVDQQAATRTLSTKELVENLPLPPRLIPVLDFPVALADKMAAWNERRLLRDLHDIWFFLRMGVEVDDAHLSKHLKKPDYSRLVPAAQRLKDKTPSGLNDLLHTEVLNLTETKLRESLSDLLPDMELAGLDMRMKAEFTRRSNRQ